MTLLIYSLLLLYCLPAGIAPYINSGKWWIRLFDFPRLHFGLLAAYLFCWTVLLSDRLPAFLLWPTLAALIAVIVISASAVWPYTRWHRKTVKDFQLRSRNNQQTGLFSCVVSNLNYQNKTPARLINQLESLNHDFLVLIELDERVRGELSSYLDEYPYKVEQVMPKGLGIAVYSNYEILESEIMFQVSEERPSIRVKIRLGDGSEIAVYAIHPAPPALKRRKDDDRMDSRSRDAELIVTAERIKQESLPVIAIGDFNDSAWSYTTKMFQKVSGLLDPRIGRGIFSTYPAKWPAFQVPIDHAFISDVFKVVHLQKLRNYGSDHLGIYCKLAISKRAEPGNEEVSSPSPADQQNAEEMKTEGYEQAKDQKEL